MAVTTKIPGKIRLFIYSSVFLGWASGVLYFLFDKFIIIEGEFGLTKHFLQSPIMKTHAAVAFILIILFGFMLSNHVKYSWRIKPVKKLGITLILFDAILIFSSYALYYLVYAGGREITANIHTIIGVIYPVILYLHIKFVRSQSSNNKVRLK